jgi:hypothetical protein
VTTHVHPHTHPHPHDSHEDESGAGHSHPHADAPVDPEAAQLGPSDPGSVILDIGGDRGSLIIMTSEELSGAEIEISPVGADGERTHIAIRERRAPAGTRWAGIFPPLLEGEYTVWGLDGTARERVRVVGGEVTQIDWR